MLRARLTRTVAALAAAGIVAGSFAALGVHASPTAGGCTPEAGWPAARPALAAQVITLINAHRKSIGLAPLATSPALTASATWKARHMAAYGYMGHDDPAPPVARPWYERIVACGFAGSAGENLAEGFPNAAAAVQAWLADPPHKANLEGPWNMTGVGVAIGADGAVFWAQDFGRGSGGGSSDTSSANPHCVVPNVFRLPFAKAAARVRAAGCGASRLPVHAGGSEVRVGAVVWQSPRKAVTMPKGAVVTLAVRVAN